MSTAHDRASAPPAAASPESWHAANQRALLAALAEVRVILLRHAGLADDAASEAEDQADDHPRRAGRGTLVDRLDTLAIDLAERLEEAVDRITGEDDDEACVSEPDDGWPGHAPATAGSMPSALATLCATFRLSDFERRLLVLCAGIELDATFPSLCAAAHGDPARTYPTFGLGLAALPQPHWSALAPDAALRRWRLVEVGPGPLTTAPLRISEVVLHYLTGLSVLDERLESVVEAVEPTASLVPSQAAVARQMTATWMRMDEAPLLLVCGPDAATRRNVAHAAASDLGLRLLALPTAAIPPTPADLDAFGRLWGRDAVLSRLALLVECDDTDAAEPSRLAAVRQVCKRLSGAVAVSSRERLSLPGRTVVPFEVPRPSMAEQRDVWLGVAGPALPGSQVDDLISQFDLEAGDIVASAKAAANQDIPVWDACRSRVRPAMGGLAHRVVPSAGWDDLILPPALLETLRDIAAQARHRATVYGRWGFGTRETRGLGLSVLFAGPSGTGKTLAAEVLARELRLDLYRVELSTVVSKYIGETEKNLDHVFRTAEAGGVMVVFDEAEAYFGQRTRTRDSHDRYANQEISYLLQRMEAYRGLAVLTTNMKEALDPAFLRRLRFTVTFPFPDAALREQIWRRIFPPATPTDGLDVVKLAQLDVSGGNIHAMALNAAFLAAAAGQPVRMEHLLRAARSEYAKLDRPLTRSEVGGWV